MDSTSTPTTSTYSKLYIKSQYNRSTTRRKGRRKTFVSAETVAESSPLYDILILVFYRTETKGWIRKSFSVRKTSPPSFLRSIVHSSSSHRNFFSYSVLVPLRVGGVDLLIKIPDSNLTLRSSLSRLVARLSLPTHVEGPSSDSFVIQRSLLIIQTSHPKTLQNCITGHRVCVVL